MSNIVHLEFQSKNSTKEVKKNAKHVKALSERWEKEMREKDNNPDNN